MLLACTPEAPRFWSRLHNAPKAPRLTQPALGQPLSARYEPDLEERRKARNQAQHSKQKDHGSDPTPADFPSTGHSNQSSTSPAKTAANVRLSACLGFTVVAHPFTCESRAQLVRLS